LDGSTPEPLGPLNSSLHTSFHFASFAGEADSCAFASTGKNKSKNATTASTLIVINARAFSLRLQVNRPLTEVEFENDSGAIEGLPGTTVAQDVR
jgi:hypothetical protein